MDILFVFNAEIGDRYANILSLLKNIEALISQDHQVTLIVKKRRLFSDLDKELHKSARFFGVKSLPKIVGIYWPINFFGRFFSFISSLYALNKNPDFVWSRDALTSVLIARRNIPVILEHHSTFTKRTQNSIKSTFELNAFKGILAISNKHKNILTNYGLNEKKIVVAHSGIDTDFIARVIDRGTDTVIGNKPTIMYAGSFYEGRGINQILKLAELNPNYEFHCIGEERISNKNNLFYYNKMPRNELIRFLSNADILIAPYTSNSKSVSGQNISNYQSPLKLMEYMALEKPIISTNVGAIPEIITHGLNGLLFNENDIYGMSKSINEILTNKDLKETLSINAGIHARNFTWKKRVNLVCNYMME